MPELLIRRNVQLAADKNHPFPRDLKRRPTPKGSVEKNISDNRLLI